MTYYMSHYTCHIYNGRVYKVVPIEVQNGQIKNKTPPTKIVTTIDLPVGFCQIMKMYGQIAYV